jgi:hypothetical protein
MLGPGWHEGTGSASVNRPGAGGQQIHGGPFYGRAHGYYFDPVEGRPHSIQVNFAWCLRDVNPGDGALYMTHLCDSTCLAWWSRDVATCCPRCHRLGLICTVSGGFCLVPGSHKMRLPIPRPPTLSIDLPAVKHLRQRAGDIVFYHGGSTTHGVMRWAGAQERRAVLKSAGPRSYPSSGQPARM